MFLVLVVENSNFDCCLMMEVMSLKNWSWRHQHLKLWTGRKRKLNSFVLYEGDITLREQKI